MKKKLVGFCGAVLVGLTACAGEEGTNGKDGAQGETGDSGNDGLTSLVDLSEVQPGGQCEAGGQRISTGLDLNTDGTLDLDEVQTVNYVCNAIGVAGNTCSVTDNADGSATISCTDGTTATVSDGEDGLDGESCTVLDNGDGSKTVTCSDGTSVTIFEGAGGASGEGVLVASATSVGTTNLGDTVCVPNPDLTLTLTVPSSGTIVLDGTVWLQLGHTSGTKDQGWVGFHDVPSVCPDPQFLSAFQIPAQLGNDTAYNVSLPVSRTFTVSAGTHTYYLVGTMQQGHDAADNFWYGNASAVFIPD